MAKWILRLAAGAVKNPDEAAKTFIYVIGGVIGTFLIIGIFSMNMIGSLLNQKDSAGSDLIDSEYEVESTVLYKRIKDVYDEFCADMIKAMDEREAEIIAENTTYEDVEVTDENGNVVIEKRAVCNVTVIKLWNDFSLSYLFAYINHASEVKSNINYKFNKKEIYGVCKSICSLKETGPINNTYNLFTTVVTPEEAAKILFSEEDKQDMYVVSYDLYDDFLLFTSNTYASVGSNIDTDGSGTAVTDGSRGTKANGNASDKLKALFPDGLPQTEAEMQKYLTTVSIDVIDKDGNLTKRNLTVHRALADDVEAIFAEIAAAGFAAYDVGAYSWRQMAASGNRSHHSYGVAIDINPNENYMVKNGKIIAGNCWSPSNNPYSIGPDSAVVKAFQSRGWVWGGTWNSSKDYMHFSYTGY